ncbi:chondroitinase-B domain-containing protein [Pedomonas sp. V897]|uniref:chondroitinase-B domain-containing protein n=1 Tax=Pedomonas sp. V897 TaxID=3446482 RepID=UPI003EE24D76
MTGRKDVAWGRRLVRLAAILTAVMAAAIGALALWTQYRFQEPFLRTWSRALGPELEWQRAKYPSIDWAFAAPAALMGQSDSRRVFEILAPADEQPPLVLSRVVGPRLLDEPLPARYTAEGVPLPAMGPADVSDPSSGIIERWPAPTPVVVSTTRELGEAIRNARPGDHILLQPGSYLFRGGGFEVRASGTPDKPIFLRAARLGDVTLRIGTTQGFTVYGGYWVFENLLFQGVCNQDEDCEHALHVVANARGTIIRNNVMRNFNAAIKVNLGRKRTQAPDFGLIEGNRFNNDHPRKTYRPVTLIDVVGADGWRITSNIIADYAKGVGDNVSYAAFIKGASHGGVFERNLVMCEWRHRGGIRLGLSLGGGGTDTYACRDGQCAFENDGGVIRNNVILNCPNDVGIYLNKAANAVIHNNLVAGTTGIDVRYPQSDALIFNNIIDGRVKERNGGKATLEKNVVSGLQAAVLGRTSSSLLRAPLRGDFSVANKGALAGKGRALAAGRVDFCGRLHDAAKPDIGPFSLSKGTPCAEPWIGGGTTASR